MSSSRFKFTDPSLKKNKNQQLRYDFLHKYVKVSKLLEFTLKEDTIDGVIFVTYFYKFQLETVWTELLLPRIFIGDHLLQMVAFHKIIQILIYLFLFSWNSEQQSMVRKIVSMSQFWMPSNKIWHKHVSWHTYRWMLYNFSK